MRDGRFTQVGSPQQVYRQPTDRFTAEFLGDCISLPCTVASGVADCALGPHTRAGIGRRRARHASCCGPNSLSRRWFLTVNSLDGVGTVIATEFLGHDVLLTIDPAGDAAPIIVRQHSLNPPPIDAKVRDRGGGQRGRAQVSRLLDHLRGHGDNVAGADRHASSCPTTTSPTPSPTPRASTRRASSPGGARNPQRPGHFGALPGGDGRRPRGAACLRPDATTRRSCRRMNPTSSSTPTESTIADGGRHRLHDDLALLLSTSGSTGSPKLVRLSHAQPGRQRRPPSPNTSVSAKPTGPQPPCRCRTATACR